MNHDHAKSNAVPSEPRLKVASVSTGSRSCSLVFLLWKARWEKQSVLQEKLQNFKESLEYAFFRGMIWVQLCVVALERQNVSRQWRGILGCLMGSYLAS